MFYPASLATKALADHSHDLAVVIAVAIFVACAGYQCSGWKSRLLHACAAPMSPAAPLSATYREGFRCGTRCVGTSWSAMSLLLALGFMHTAAMAVIAAALLVERRADRRAVSIALGTCALIYGIGVAVHPGLAPGLGVPTVPDMGMMN